MVWIFMKLNCGTELTGFKDLSFDQFLKKANDIISTLDAREFRLARAQFRQGWIHLRRHLEQETRRRRVRHWICICGIVCGGGTLLRLFRNLPKLEDRVNVMEQHEELSSYTILLRHWQDLAQSDGQSVVFQNHHLRKTSWTCLRITVIVYIHNQLLCPPIRQAMVGAPHVK